MRFRLATTTDLEIIRSWLKKEYDRSRAGKGFYGNINGIEKGQEKDELTVAIDDKDNLPVAFYHGNRCNAAILEVRPGYRRKGIGRLLVEHIIKCAKDKGYPGISGFCSPEKSLPFWLKMGFERVHNPNQTPEVAYPIRQKRQLPLNCERYDITFKLYEDSGGNNLHKTQVISAALCGQDYELEEDFVEYVYNSNSLLVIVSSGQELFRDEIRRIDEIGGEYEMPWLRVNEIIR
jgi:GNAT superfamily N-acetyltransferase